MMAGPTTNKLSQSPHSLIQQVCQVVYKMINAPFQPEKGIGREKMTSTHGHHQHNSQHQENFAKFFQWWLSQQDRDLQDLLLAASSPPPSTPEEENDRVRPLLSRVIAHYEDYYKKKSASAKRDVLPMFTPNWTSSTENLFLWVGGWRPSMAFHLLYSKSGLQLESKIADLINGLTSHDLSDLSTDQLNRIDELQRKTIRLEKEISEEEAKVQETVAYLQLVDLAHVVTEMEGTGGDVESVEAMESEMKGKREGMEKVLEMADKLRLDTLTTIVDILRSMQAVHFLIAAAELHLRVHEFGKKKDTDAAAAATASGN